MKKFKILVALAIMVCMISAVSFAADTDYATFGVDTVEYSGEPLTITVKAGVEYTSLMNTITVYFDSDVWTVSNASTGANIMPGYVAYSYSGMATGATTTYAAGADIFSFTATLVDGKDAAGSEFVIDYIQAINADGSDVYANADLTGSADCVDKLTVVAAGPSFEDNDYSNAKIVPNTNDIEVGGKKYTNVAVFDGSFSLADVKAGLETGESVKEAGVMFNGEKKATIAVAGDGNVAYTVLFYGITPEQAAGLNINTYYTLTEIAD